MESGGRKKPGVLRFDRVTAKSAMSLVQSFFLRHSVYDGIAAEPALGMGEVGPCPGPRASEPLCETAVFAMLILSTANFCPMLIL